MMSEPIRVLHVVGAMYPGGYENFIMNLYENIDRDRFQFDMVIHSRKKNDYVDQIKAMGGRVYELPRLVRKPFSNLHQMRKLVKENGYPLVIRHTSNALVTPQLWAAKRGGAYTICHSHSTNDPQLMLHKLGRLLMPVAASECFACSPEAGKWMFGKRPYREIHNAINIEKFRYSEEKAQKVRSEFGFENCHVYGHIGNFIECKNHVFLIEVFHEISKIDPDARFVCLGDGDMRPQIEEKVRTLGLEGKVFLPGTRKDAQNFMSCFDTLIFPSVFEGLPLTLIEAQAAGLPCLISDTITRDVVKTEGIVYHKSLQDSAESWAKKAIDMGMHADRTCQRERIAAAGYDIEALAKWYEGFIEEISRKKR